MSKYKLFEETEEFLAICEALSLPLYDPKRVQIAWLYIENVRMRERLKVIGEYELLDFGAADRPIPFQLTPKAEAFIGGHQAIQNQAIIEPIRTAVDKEAEDALYAALLTPVPVKVAEDGEL